MDSSCASRSFPCPSSTSFYAPAHDVSPSYFIPCSPSSKEVSPAAIANYAITFCLVRGTRVRYPGDNIVQSHMKCRLDPQRRQPSHWLAWWCTSGSTSVSLHPPQYSRFCSVTKSLKPFRTARANRVIRRCFLLLWTIRIEASLSSHCHFDCCFRSHNVQISTLCGFAARCSWINFIQSFEWCWCLNILYNPPQRVLTVGQHNPDGIF